MEVEGTEIGSFSVVEGCSARGGGDGGPAERGRSRELIDNHQFPSNAPGEPPPDATPGETGRSKTRRGACKGGENSRRTPPPARRAVRPSPRLGPLSRPTMVGLVGLASKATPTPLATADLVVLVAVDLRALVDVAEGVAHPPAGRLQEGARWRDRRREGA